MTADVGCLSGNANVVSLKLNRISWLIHISKVNGNFNFTVKTKVNG